MKVLHINSYCGDSKFYKNLFVEERNLGIDITAYIPVSEKKDISTMDFGSDAIISKTYDDADRFTFIGKHKKILNDVQKKVDVSEFDMLHAHSLFSNGYVAYMLSKKYGIPYIVAVRDTDVNFFFKKFFFMRKLGIKILESASKVVFISPMYRENALVPYVKAYKASEIYKKSLVLPNGIDDFWLDNLYFKNWTVNKDNVKIISVARISKRKNLISLARACERLISEKYNIELTVIGKIEDKKEYKRLIKFPFVKYIAPCRKEELIDYYRKNDIFVLPSHTETFGLVYAEAMSQGLPVIYTKGQGFDRQFADGTVGYAVDSHSVDDICDKIKMCILSNNFSKDVETKLQGFKWSDIALNYGKIYSSVI